MFFGLSAVFFYDKVNDTQVTINVYNWGEFISDGSNELLNVNEEFTKKTGIKVNYMTFQSNEALFAKLQSGGTKYDVIIPSDYMVSKLIEKDMLRKLDFNKLSNFKFIDDEFKNPVYDPKNEYSVPYVWSSVGIIYNKKYVSKCKEDISWDILFDQKYKGKILMFDNPRDAFSIAQLKLGIDINSKDIDDWNRAFEELKNQRPLVQSYVMDQIFDKMGNEEAYLAPYYAGDAINLMNINPNIDVVIPKNGTVKFVDAMCIPKNSEHPDEALKYINFMCEPEVAKANVTRIGYSTPEAIVRESLALNDKQIELNYPREEITKKSQTFKNLPDNVSEKLENLWTFVKIGKLGNNFVLFSILSLMLIIYVILFFIRRKS